MPQTTPNPFGDPAPAPRFQPAQPSPAPPIQRQNTLPNPQTLQQGVFISESSQFPIVVAATQRIRQLKQEARSGLTSQRSVARNRVQISQRNTPALFGAGLIDSIPESALLAVAKIRHEDSPRVSGRIARDKQGKVGRFGWKAQKTSLAEFTMAACAVELGLNVPGHAQAGVPYKPNHKSKGLDLNAKQLAALVNYLKELPRPIQRKPKNVKAAAVIDEGERLFENVGCAACHTRKLGDVDGLYGDLLLHDMGSELGGTGSYGVFTPSDPGQDAPENSQAGSQAGSQPRPVKVVTATQVEWRTPPLWGVRDSAPYLHDGRVATLEQAIAFHGGEASDSTIKFFMLSNSKQQKVIAFLKSLTAPDTNRAATTSAKLERETTVE